MVVKERAARGPARNKRRYKVSTLTRRGRHERDRPVTLIKEKQRYFSENPTHNQRGLNPGRMHDRRGGQALHQCTTSPSLEQFKSTFTRSLLSGGE